MARQTRKTICHVGDLSFELERKRVKNINLRIRQDGSVYVSAPARVSLSQIQSFVESRRPWIERRRQTFVSRAAAAPRTWSIGETISLWGEELRLELVEAPGPRRESVTKSGTQLVLAVAAQHMGLDDAAISHRRKLVLAWLTEQLREAATPLLAQYEQRMGVHASMLRFRAMKTRWGSCNTKTAAITLNTQLAQLPQTCLESVVVHELCHLLEPSHDARFHVLMDRHYPMWREARRLLNASSPIGI